MGVTWGAVSMCGDQGQEHPTAPAPTTLTKGAAWKATAEKIRVTASTNTALLSKSKNPGEVLQDNFQGLHNMNPSLCKAAVVFGSG